MPSRRKAEVAVDRHGRIVTPPQAALPSAQSAEDKIDETIYPLLSHLLDATIFFALLPYLTFHDYLAIGAVSAEVRKVFDEDTMYREAILERYLAGVGYWQWERIYEGKAVEAVEPLALNLKVRDSIILCCQY